MASMGEFQARTTADPNEHKGPAGREPLSPLFLTLCIQAPPPPPPPPNMASARCWAASPTDDAEKQRKRRRRRG
ncbi:hypothetical protein AMECASPLE_016008 [Ameca splendens]|uniref:Uncharacterized protein n=1 Tax=Ameca splendens TaxID=208324 RepID=A0ABV0XQX0_9TELE